MTRYLDNCSSCGEPQTTDLPAGRPVWPVFDLDLKPPADVAWLWPQNCVRCIGCGACWVGIGDIPREAKQFVESPEYRAVADGPWPTGFREEMAAALLAEQLGMHEFAFERHLIASWIAEDEESWLGAPESSSSLADLARTRAVQSWVAAAGDPTADLVPRCTELAQVTVTGHVLLDNQVLVDLLRRLGDWDRAQAAAASARRALAGTLAAWGGLDGLGDDEEHEVVSACEVALDLEDSLIAHRTTERAHARLDLPVWIAC